MCRSTHAIAAVMNTNHPTDRGRSRLVAAPLRQHPDWPNSSYLAADGMARGGQYEPALRYFEQSLQRSSGNALARTARGSLLASHGHLKEALDDLDRASTMDPGFAEAYH